MMFKREVPPTAGLPMGWSDWFATRVDLTQTLEDQFDFSFLQLECSGTSALVVALKTLSNMVKNKGRDEVIVPAYNCPLVIFAIYQCGLKPVLCDTIIDGFDFDHAHLHALVGPKTLALVPAHLGGQLADVVFACSVAHKHGAYVIEDAAQAFGTGAGHIGDIAFFSLAVGKGLTLYEGGLLTAKDSDMQAALKQTHDEIVFNKPFFEFKRILELLGYCAFYRPLFLNWFYGYPRRKALARDDLVDAVGDVFDSAIPIHKVSRFRAKRGAKACLRLRGFLHQTHAQAQKRLKQLNAIHSIKVLGNHEAVDNSWPFFMVLMPSVQSRDAVLEKLWASPFGVSRLFIHALGQYDYLKPYLGHPQNTPHAQNLSERMLTISNSLWLKQTDFDYVCDVIKEQFKIIF